MRKSPRGAGENPPYRWLARYYDRLFTFHLPWFQAGRNHILGGILPLVESACDLACGTGTTSVLLARRGIRVYGVDLSPIMCRLARAKARQRHAAVLVIRGDMRNFRLPEQVAWSAVEMRRAMREAGFDRARAFDATPFFGGDPRIEPGCRTFYLARKG